MRQRHAVYQWMDTVARQIPQVRQSQAKVWAAGRWGVAVARRGAHRGVAEARPRLGKPDTVARRRHRFVATPRLDWRGGAQGVAAWLVRSVRLPAPLVVLVDETSLPAPRKVMGVRLADRGRAFPLAWGWYRQEAGPLGQGALMTPLRHQSAPSIPAGGPVVGQADRGSGGRPAWRAAIEALGWDFVGRGQRTGRLQVGGRAGPLGTWVAKPGARWTGAGRACKTAGWRAGWAGGRGQGR